MMIWDSDSLINSDKTVNIHFVNFLVTFNGIKWKIKN